ncbi:FecR family protein [Dyadobacter bucti]|uniref:FecR family protein n=1 Tax=Dyadobacter bucti TaxID=2572203 RepID=UPI001108F4A5|nr:FecR domain-containing protein [Dyadobacter bucti]
MNTPSVNKSLILNYFAGTASPMQKRLIRDWLASEENQELYFEWLAEWQTQSPQYLVQHADARFDAFIDFMKENPPVKKEVCTETEVSPVTIQTGERFVFRKKWLIAACFLLCFLTWAGREKIYFKTFRTPYGKTSTVILDDGTRVILNANTSMTVPRFGFGNKTREVTLDGEAFFVVKHTIDNKKFLVKTARKFEVMVLGTEFSVYTRSQEAKVLLKKGKVQVRYTQGSKTNQIMMKPGDLMTLQKTGKPNLKTKTDTKTLTAWTEHRFVFDKTPLKEVTRQIREHYGMQIAIPDSTFANRAVSGTFQPESGEELLTLLSEMFGFKLDRSGKTILMISN